MQKIVILLAVMLALSGCVHKMNIEQGNMITQDMRDRIRLGMTESQVKAIMGTPVLVNTFNDNRLDYVYTYKPAYAAGTEKQITLIFRNHILSEITGNMYSQFMVN